MSKRRIEQDQEPGMDFTTWLYLEGAAPVDPLERWDREIKAEFDKMDLEADKELEAMEAKFQEEMGHILNAGAADLSRF